MYARCGYCCVGWEETLHGRQWVTAYLKCMFGVFDAVFTCHCSVHLWNDSWHLLRYAIVTRPVRQGRLKLALEEVLSYRPDPSEPCSLQTAPDQAAAALSAAVGTPFPFVSSLSHQPASSQEGRFHQGVFQTAPGQNGNASALGEPLQGRQDSRRSSGQMSTVSSASGSVLPSPSELAPLKSMSSIAGSNPSSQGTDLEYSLHTRRHSLHRAPKVCLSTRPHPLMSATVMSATIMSVTAHCYSQS